MVIRPATETDIPEVTAIYNDVIRVSTAIYRDDPVTTEDRLVWWQAHREMNYPVLVADKDGSVLGFATYSDFRAAPGYRHTVEASIHLREGARRHGIGTRLLSDLIQLARAQGKHMMIAGVDSENKASRSFLEKLGSEQTGYLKEVGYKFGRYLDLVFYQIKLS